MTQAHTPVAAPANGGDSYGTRSNRVRCMKRAQFTVSYPDRLLHPLHRHIVEGTSVSRVEILMWSPTRDATTLVWCDGDRETTESVVSTLDSVLVSNLVPGADGTYAFLLQDDYEFPAAIRETVATSSVIFLPPVVFLASGDVAFEAVGEAAALSTFHDALSELGDLAVDSVHAFERLSSSSRLTDRQRAALEAAVDAGYYEIPRRGTLGDVADSLDCSTSTAGELVRKAEAAVVRTHVR